MRNIPDAIGHINRLIVHGGTNVSQVRRALCEDQTEFGQMSSQRIDCLRSLPDKALMGTAFSLSGPPPEMARGASFYRDDAAWLLLQQQTWKLRFARSIDNMCASAICSSFARHRGAGQHHTMPVEGGIHGISSIRFVRPSSVARHPSGSSRSLSRTARLDLPQ